MNKNKIPLKKKQLFFAGNKLAFSVILIFAVFIIIEITTGLSVHSVSLLANAELNLITISVFASSLFAFRFLKIPTEEKYRRHYRILSLIILVLNITVTLATLCIVILLVINKKFNPAPELTVAMNSIGTAGLIINAITIFIFRKEKTNDRRIENSWSSVRNNFFFSGGLIIFAAAINYWKWYDIDIGYGFIMLAITFFYVVNLIQKKIAYRIIM